MHNYSPRAFPFSDFSCNQFHESTLRLEEQNRLQFILGIVVCCLGMAIFFAPETPQDFASICTKYNTDNACQVW